MGSGQPDLFSDCMQGNFECSEGVCKCDINQQITCMYYYRGDKCVNTFDNTNPYRCACSDYRGFGHLACPVGMFCCPKAQYPLGYGCCVLNCGEDSNLCSSHCTDGKDVCISGCCDCCCCHSSHLTNTCQYGTKCFCPYNKCGVHLDCEFVAVVCFC